MLSEANSFLNDVVSDLLETPSDDAILEKYRLETISNKIKSCEKELRQLRIAFGKYRQDPQRYSPQLENAKRSIVYLKGALEAISRKISLRM